MEPSGHELYTSGIILTRWVCDERFRGSLSKPVPHKTSNQHQWQKNTGSHRP